MRVTLILERVVFMLSEMYAQTMRASLTIGWLEICKALQRGVNGYTTRGVTKPAIRGIARTRP
jgi:hypothetical protein